MATQQWTTHCRWTGTEIIYSDLIYQSDRARGLGRPNMTSIAALRYRRELRSVAMPHIQLPSAAAGKRLGEIPDAPFGRIGAAADRHELRYVDDALDTSAFGVKEAQLEHLCTRLLRDDVPVAIAIAPTGSGKSTYLPYRLLVPPENAAAAPDSFYRFGQIVITQPRIAPTRSITPWVATAMHGAGFGVNFEIGYQFSGAPLRDWRNRLVYVTDGSLINWLIRGDVERIGLVMIDEAHERSLNIDVILGLLARLIPRHPHLKVVIASATIDHARFKGFFDSHLPQPLHAEVMELSGKEGISLETHFRPARKPSIDYARTVTSELASFITEQLVEEVVELLVRMYLGNAAAGVPDSEGEVVMGDVIGFLHTATSIDAAYDDLRQCLAKYPEIEEVVDLCKLHRNLSPVEHELATADITDTSRRRVIIASNIAETSMTIDGIVHVVDSGLIIVPEWDAALAQDAYPTRVHSQSGCRQRHGRAGRKTSGHAWCLYTKEQFADEELFKLHSIPEIKRSALDKVALTARMAGAQSLLSDVYPWIEEELDAEIVRAEGRLRKQGALDADGDLTELGVELRNSNDDGATSELIALADRFACAIEMATVVPIIELGLAKLFVQGRAQGQAKRRVADYHAQVRAAADDDLELSLKLYVSWKMALDGGPMITGSPHWSRFWAPRLTLPLADQLSKRDQSQLLKQARGATRPRDFRSLSASSRTTPALLGQCVANLQADFIFAASATWGAIHFMRHEFFLEEVEPARVERIRELSRAKKEDEFRAIRFDALPRMRVLFARCLREECYQYVAGDETQPRTYQKYFPSDNATVVELADASVLSPRQPDTFVACGPKRSSKARDGQSRVLVPFVVVVGREVFDSLQEDMSVLGLALFLARRYPLRGGVAHEIPDRLLLDQAWPVGSIAKVRVGEQSEDGRYHVELIERCRRDQTERYAGPEVRGNEVDPNAEDLTLFGTDSWYRPEEVEAMQVAREEEELIDLVAEATPEVQLGRPDDEPYLLSDPVMRPLNKDESHAENSPRPAALENRQFAACLRLLTAKPRSKLIEAEVVGYGSEDGEHSVVMLEHPTRWERLRQLVEGHAPGDAIEVEVLLGESWKNRRVDLSVREVRTLCDATLPASLYSLSGTSRVLEDAIPAGSRFQARLEEIDQESGRVLCSTLPVLDAALEELHFAPDQPRSAVVAGVESGRVVLHVKPPRPEHGCVILAHLWLPDSLIGESFATLGLRLGETRDVVLTFSDAFQTIAGLDRSKKEDVGRLVEAGVLHDEQRSALRWEGRMNLSQRDELVGAMETEAARGWVHSLYTHSNQPYARLYFGDLSSRFEQNQEVAGVVSRFQRDRVLLLLDDGVHGEILSSEMSWLTSRAQPRESFEIGQTVEGRVKSVDTRQQVVQLTLRTGPNPWVNGELARRYPEDTSVRVRVRQVIERGAFVRVEGPLEGFLPSSFFNEPPPLADDELDVAVSGLDTKRFLIDFRVGPNPWHNVAERYPVGSIVEGWVIGMKVQRAFVSLEAGVEGELRRDQLSWAKLYTAASERLSYGERVRCKVIGIKSADRKIQLSLRDLEEDPWLTHIPETLNEGTAVTGVVTRVLEAGVRVELEPEIEGFLSWAKSGEHGTNGKTTEIGDSIEVVVDELDQIGRRLLLKGK